jgi:aromatic ring-opening dioxygenase catalytic subunit (LigB family)
MARALAGEIDDMADRLPTLFIPHGGGPCFFMDPRPPLPLDLWDGMAAYLRGLGANLGRRPKAVLVVSAHWEAARPTVNVGERPSLLFDYYNFPEHTYRLTYPAPGAPELGARVRGLLAAAGFESDTDASRGFDHGVFVPFKLIYPEADVPVLQLSLTQGLDPAEHLAIGRALAPLRDEGVLIVGSGMSYHNLRQMFSGQDDAASHRFDAWLNETLSDPGRRDAGLIAWREAPGGLECHPREEHLLPLMVAAGAAEDEPAVRTYGERLVGKALSGFQFG